MNNFMRSKIRFLVANKRSEMQLGLTDPWYEKTRIKWFGILPVAVRGCITTLTYASVCLNLLANGMYSLSTLLYTIRSVIAGKTISCGL